ncbi:MAG: thioredoxin domain-containing protein [Candidatus Paceibacterota bacterium]
MKKHGWKIIFGVAVLLLVGSYVIAQDAAKKANEGITIDRHVKGNTDAAVLLTEYSDFQCPACGQFYPVVKEIMETYGDNLQLEYKHFPLITIHPYAVPAARAAEAAAQQGKFWEMHDLLFENQSAWSQGSNPDAFFIQYAGELGLDVATFKRHLGASVITDAVNNSFKDAQALGLTGTPTFFLNGERMEFDTFEDFMNQIEVAINGSETATTSISVESEADVTFGI